VNSLVTILNAHVEQERRSKQFLKNTISDISHQLKTPLAALNIYNGLLQGEAVDVPEIQEFTSLSEKELDRINTLVQNLLKITKLDAGSIVLEKKPEDVAEMMNNVELRFSYRAEQEQKKLVLFGEEDIFLSCDRDWILEAVDNIVKNAMDHTKSGDTIEIKWRKSASIVQIQIKDNGSGIHPEDLHHIFKRFYRSRFSKDQQGIGPFRLRQRQQFVALPESECGHLFPCPEILRFVVDAADQLFRALQLVMLQLRMQCAEKFGFPPLPPRHAVPLRGGDYRRTAASRPGRRSGTRRR
jgi:signal transduction histidine kinase